MPWMTQDVDSHQPTGIELAPGFRVATSTVRFKFVRASGPGGQNVNKVSSACELRLWINDLSTFLTPGAFARLRDALGSRLTSAGEIQIVSDEHRTQEQNRAAVLDRLRTFLIAARTEPKRRKKTKPSYASKQRRLEGKKRRSEIKGNRRGGIE